MAVPKTWVAPDNGDPTIVNDKSNNTGGFNQDDWERANPQKAMAAAKTVAGNKKMASKTFSPQWAPTTAATTTVRPDGTVVIEWANDEEDTNRQFAVGKALEAGGTTTPTPPAFNPEIDSTVFGEAASQRNQLDPKFLENRNSALANSIGTKLGWNNIKDLSDSDIKKAIVQDLAQKGAPMDNPQIVDTIFDIQNRVRKGQSSPWTSSSGASQTSQGGGMGAQKSSTEYFNDLVQGIPVSASNADAQNATQRYAKFSTYSTMTSDQLSVSIANNSLIPGDQTWTDLNNAGMGEKLQQAQQLNTFKSTQRTTSSVYPVLNTDPNVSLSSQSVTPPQQTDIFGALMMNVAQGMNTNFAAMYQQMVVKDPLISKQRENVVAQQGKVAEIENQIASLQNELKNQIISNGGVVTDGYLSSLLAERTQPLERQLATANIQLGVSTNLLNMNMQLAQQTLSFAQQDFSNKQAALGLITQIGTTQAQLAQQRELAKQFVPEGQYNEAGVFDPFTGQFTGYNNQNSSSSSSSSSSVATQNSDGSYDFSNVQNPSFRKDTTGDAWLNNNNPGNIKGGDVGNGISDSGFTIYSTPQEGWDALLRDIEAKKGNTKADYTIETLGQRYTSTWPKERSKSLAATLGVPTSTKISNIPTQTLAKAISKQESAGMYNVLFGGQQTSQQSGSPVSSNTRSVAQKYGIPPKFDSTLQSLADGTTDLATATQGQGLKYTEEMQAAARQLNPKWTPDTYKIIQQFKDPSAPIAQGINAINTAYEHISDLKSTFGNLNTTQYPWANQKIQDIQKAGLAGNPKAQEFLAQYNTIKTYLTDELAKVNVGGGGLTDADKAATDSIFSSSLTPSQFLGQLSGINSLVAGKLWTLAGQWKQTTNAPLNQSDFVKNEALLKNGLKRDPTKGLVLTLSKGSQQWGWNGKSALELLKRK